MIDTACPECARVASHYQDCPAMERMRATGATVILDDHEYMPKAAWEANALPDLKPEQVFDPGTCEYDGCANPRWSTDKRVKYCEDHKDPKNRKE